MLLFQIPHRLVKLSGAKFPLDATLHATLQPAELFGDAILSGRLRVRPAGQRVEMEADFFHGGIRLKPGGRFRTVKTTVPLFGETIELSGSLATMALRAVDQPTLLRAVKVMTTHLAPLLSEALQAPVQVAEVWGTAAGQRISVEVKGTFHRVVHAIDHESQLRQLFEVASAVDTQYSERILSALRYLLHARQLDYSETFPAQFLSERLLNIYKAVEVLFGRKVDDLKKSLQSMALSPEFAEVLTSLVYLRDQADIGHPAIHALTEDEYTEVYLYAEEIEQVVTWLVAELMRRAAKKKPLPILTSVSTGKDRAKTISRLADARKKIEALRPTTFFQQAPEEAKK